MATPASVVWKVLAGCQRQLLSPFSPVYAAASQTAPKNLPIRTFAAVQAAKKAKKKKGKEEEVVQKKPRVHNYRKVPRVIVDDVYFKKFYPQATLSVADAIDLLKSFQVLDFTPVNQPVYVELKLNMTLEKKKSVNPFVSSLLLPHPIKTEDNKVLVFTEQPHQVETAQQNGAAFVGGAELVQPILDGEISADFYVAVPEMQLKILPLKNKLRKKFPKSKRGMVGVDIPKMLSFFKKCHSFMVENDCIVRTQIATLDMPAEHIIANLQTILTDVCSHRPADLGPFVERATLSSETSEDLCFNSQDVLPKTEE
ncbi:large ribosomal subunit protein uL1m [Austrofundulus limnaeus]|uniref:Large ribosomal subunit protein uL1m n=1 Tax=Austrofundulus limnaeus TaxID=52670 RepID=A0A2I4BQQ2_AUSLI|nr:PREDICTED: 39S ribosomal protein L1, mitochondrial [Austrofundulus limnaeus]